MGGGVRIGKGECQFVFMSLSMDCIQYKCHHFNDTLLYFHFHLYQIYYYWCHSLSISLHYYLITSSELLSLKSDFYFSTKFESRLNLLIILNI